MKKNDIKLIFIMLIILILIFVIFARTAYPYNSCDVNRDGVVDIKDLLKVQKYILENKEVEHE